MFYTQVEMMHVKPHQMLLVPCDHKTIIIKTWEMLFNSPSTKGKR
jgi:hypothetical protein